MIKSLIKISKSLIDYSLKYNRFLKAFNLTTLSLKEPSLIIFSTSLLLRKQLEWLQQKMAREV